MGSIVPRAPEGDARSLARAVHRSRLVIFDEDLDVLVRWNGSATFNVTNLDGQDVDMFTAYDVKDAEEAGRLITEHLETWS